MRLIKNTYKKLTSTILVLCHDCMLAINIFFTICILFNLRHKNFVTNLFYFFKSV